MKKLSRNWSRLLISLALLFIGAIVTVAFDTITFDNVSLNSVFFQNGSGSLPRTVKMIAPSGLSTNYTITLPLNDGNSGQFLQTNGSGVTTWATAGGGGGSPGGSSGQVQYNNAGSFGGIIGATTDGTNLTLGSTNLRTDNPIITSGIRDNNSNLQLELSPVGSAVNFLTLANAATGNSPSLTANGADGAVSITLTPKGVGTVRLNGAITAIGQLEAQAGIVIDTGTFLNGQTDLKLSAVNNILTTTAFVEPNTSLTDSGTAIGTDAHVGNNFRVTPLTANVTLANPTNPSDGQVITWEIIQNAASAKTLAFGTKFGFGAEITACTISPVLSSHNFITAIYNSTTDKWYIRGCLTGY